MSGAGEHDTIHDHVAVHSRSQADRIAVQGLLKSDSDHGKAVDPVSVVRDQRVAAIRKMMDNKGA